MLSPDEVTALYQKVVKEKGCPVDVPDRLTACEYGVKMALDVVRYLVSVDAAPKSVGGEVLREAEE